MSYNFDFILMEYYIFTDKVKTAICEDLEIVFRNKYLATLDKKSHKCNICGIFYVNLLIYELCLFFTLHPERA